jgi:hypothetical protein
MEPGSSLSSGFWAYWQCQFCPRPGAQKGLDHRGPGSGAAMAPNGFITSNNVVLVAIHRAPGSHSLVGGLRALPDTGSSAGRPSGAGQLLLHFLPTPSQQPGFGDRTPRWQAWQCRVFSLEVPGLPPTNSDPLLS